MFQMSVDSESGENVDEAEVESTENDCFVRQDSLSSEGRGEYNRSASEEIRRTWTNSFRRRTNTVRKLLRKEFRIIFLIDIHVSLTRASYIKHILDQ